MLLININIICRFFSIYSVLISITISPLLHMNSFFKLSIKNKSTENKEKAVQSYILLFTALLHISSTAGLKNK